jgi:hypothetical protein
MLMTWQPGEPSARGSSKRDSNQVIPQQQCRSMTDQHAPAALCLQGERPLNCMLAGYFSRVMGSLLLRRTQEVMQYLQRQPALLDRMVEHVDTTSVAEVLVRLVGADEQRACLSNSQLQVGTATGAASRGLGRPGDVCIREYCWLGAASRYWL